MPSPQVKTAEEEAEEELDALQEAEEAAADQRPDGADGDVAVDDLGQQASATPEVGEEALADPVPSGSDSFFSGTEGMDDSEGEPMPDDVDARESEEPMDEFADAAPDDDHSFEEPIVEGAARLSVVGLDDGDEKDELQDEFEEVFEAFQLGHYGDRVMKEYLLKGDDDVNPVWGLAASSFFCTVMVVYLRPDGDEVVSTVRERLQDIAGGDS